MSSVNYVNYGDSVSWILDIAGDGKAKPDGHYLNLN